jgi:hypothetical protein
MKMILNFKEVYMKKFMMILFLLSTQAFLVNCAKSSDNSANSNLAAGQCQVNYVNTTYGCMPLSTNGQCQAGYGYSPQYGCLPPTYNNYGTGQTCQAGYVSTTSGCLPLSVNGQCQAGYGYSPQYGCLPPTYNNGVGGVGGTCQAGTVGTVMGCLPQGQCPVNYGYYYGAYNGQNGGWCYMRTY